MFWEPDRDCYEQIQESRQYCHLEAIDAVRKRDGEAQPPL